MNGNENRIDLFAQLFPNFEDDSERWLASTSIPDFMRDDDEIIMKLTSPDIDWQAIVNTDEKSLYYSTLYQLWGEPINNSFLLEELLCSLMMSINDVKADKEHILQYTCIRLLADAIRMYESINQLVSKGYVYGALSLCRKIEEDMVIALFLIKHGNEAALAYYDNVNKPIDEKDNYSWSKQFIDKNENKFGGLKALRKDSIQDFDEFQNRYDMLCKYTHPAAQTIYRDFDLEDHEVRLGPSISALSQPATLAILYLGRMLTHYTSLEYGRAFTKRVKVCLAFMDYIQRLYNTREDLLHVM